MRTPFDKSILRPGDCLLYRPTDVFDYAVALKTWTYVSHVECFIGQGFSVASRNGRGVDRYPLREDNVAAVLRPGPEFRLDMAMNVFYFGNGTPGSKLQFQKYGWVTLGTFCLLNNNPIEGHQICSEFAANWYDAGNYPLFSDIWPAYRTAPATLLTSRRLPPVWDDGRLFH
jgi:hypothetical protein